MTNIDLPFPWSGSGVSSFFDIARQYGKLNVKQAALTPVIAEMNSGTANVAFPVMVSARAALQLATRVDARQFCRTEMMPEGTGTEYHWQYIKQPTSFLPPSVGGTGIQPYTTSGTTDITATDLPLLNKSSPVNTYPARTFIEDKLQRQLAYNLSQVVGVSHGNSINANVNYNIYQSINGATNATKLSLAAGTNLTFANILNLRAQVEQKMFKPDTFITFPTDPTGTLGFYPFIIANVTSVQFTSALADYLKTGVVSELFGLKLFVDSIYTPPAAAAGAPANLGAVVQANEAIGWSQVSDITSAIQRWEPQIGFNTVTHIIGSSCAIVDEAIALAQQAA
jgi:hypothetical protein